MRHRRFIPAFDGLSLRIAPSGFDGGLAPNPDPSNPGENVADVAAMSSAAGSSSPSDFSSGQDDSGDPMDPMVPPDSTPFCSAVPTTPADAYAY